MQGQERGAESVGMSCSHQTHGEVKESGGKAHYLDVRVPWQKASADGRG